MPKQYYSESLNPLNSHIYTLKYNLAKSRNIHIYQVLDFPNEIFEDKFIVTNPLDYDNFTKLTGALRENRQQASREITMQFEKIIKNRRLAIVYLLNKAYLNNKKLNLKKLTTFLSKKAEYFVIDKADFEWVMQIELQFANICGIPYIIRQNHIIEPVVSVNETILCNNAPAEVIEYLNKFKGFTK